MYDAAASALMEIRQRAVPGPDRYICLTTYSTVGDRSWQTVAFSGTQRMRSAI